MNSSYSCFAASVGSFSRKSASPGIRVPFICVRGTALPVIIGFCWGLSLIHFSRIRPDFPGSDLISVKSSGFSCVPFVLYNAFNTLTPASYLICFAAESSSNPAGLTSFPTISRMDGTFTFSTMAGTFTFSTIAGIFTFFTTAGTFTPFVITPSPRSSPMVRAGAVVNPRHIDSPIIYIPTVAAAGNIAGLRAMATAAAGIIPAISTAAAGAWKATP